MWGTCVSVRIRCTHAHTYTGDWEYRRGHEIVRVHLECNVDSLGIRWTLPLDNHARDLDWSYHGHENIFTIVGGHDHKIIRWRPCLHDPLSDDDHLVWKPYTTNNKLSSKMQNIVYARVKRTMKYFQDTNPYDWCCI